MGEGIGSSVGVGRFKRLLFTGGGGSGTEALSRMLAQKYEVHFADADINAKPYSISINKWHQIPLASHPDFIAEVQHLTKALGVDLLIPTVDEELLLVSKAQLKLECDVLLPSENFLKTHLDKWSSNIFLREHGLPAPYTQLLQDCCKISYPVIVKPRHGRGSRGVAVVYSEEELQAHVLLSRIPAEEFIVQELLKGQEYTVMVLANRMGKLRAVVPVKVGLKKGITIRAETDRDDAVIEACAAIHAANPVPGVYNVQLIKTAEGEVKPFEINPRISTTTCLALAAGIDFISIYMDEKDVYGGEGDQLIPFENGIKLKRSWHNEITS